MALANLDPTLRSLRDAAAAIAESLLALELDPSRARLAAMPLEGETAERWARENAAVLELWESFSLLEALLERAGKLRGTRARRLLEGASIEDGAGARDPIDRRDLLSGPARCTPVELVARMVATFDAVKPVAGEIVAAQDAVLERLPAARELLDALEGTIAEGRRAAGVAQAQIAGAAAELPRFDPALGRELEHVEALVGRGAWREASLVLDRCMARAGALLDDTRRSLAADRAALRERNLLRGLLDACAAKADRLGLAGEPQRRQLLAAARDALHGAPVDLSRAAGLVERYRLSLSAAGARG